MRTCDTIVNFEMRKIEFQILIYIYQIRNDY